MPTNYTPPTANGTQSTQLLGTVDWNEEWKYIQTMRRKVDRAGFWNKRSRNFDHPDNPSPYVRAFLELAAIEDGDSVLDMGCGTGSIAVPLARSGHKVIAADFSKSMIAEAQKRAAAAHITLAETHVMAWEDTWEEFGIGAKSVDIALASRSMAVFDLGAAIDKLCTTARKRCCATMSCGTSPHMDARVLEICGLQNKHGRDYQYAFNILTNKGYSPSCQFIYSKRKDTFDSLEDACKDFGRMIDDIAHLYSEQQITEAHRCIRSWLEINLVPNESVGMIDEKGYPEKSLRLTQPRTVPWAFLSWNV